MARRLRLEFEGALYHVTLRGNGRQAIFLDDADRQRFLHRLAQGRELDQVRIFLVCLMRNHVHLLLGTPRTNLGRFMGRLLTGYTVYFNRRHGRSGHLTQGRYHAQVVEGDAYLLKLSRYIHLNPVHIRTLAQRPVQEQVRALRAFRWSTYRGYAGLELPWPWVETGPLLAQMQPFTGRPQLAYRRFVESGLAEADEEFAVLYQRAGLSLGSERFQAQIQARYHQRLETVRHREDVALRRRSMIQAPAKVLSIAAQVIGVTTETLCVRRRGSWLRAAAAWALQRFAGLDQRAIAHQLGMGTGAAVSQQLARWQAAAADKKVSAWRREMMRLLEEPNKLLS